MEPEVTGKYETIITSVTKKYGRYAPNDKEDIRQEIELALLGVGDVPDKLAYRIAQRTAINYLRHLPPRYEDITDPDVLRKYDKQHSYSPDVDAKIDAKIAVHLVNQLPNPYRLILIASFGLGCEPITESEIAERLGHGQTWVHENKKAALERLRNMMKQKEIDVN